MKPATKTLLWGKDSFPGSMPGSMFIFLGVLFGAGSKLPGHADPELMDSHARRVGLPGVLVHVT